MRKTINNIVFDFPPPSELEVGTFIAVCRQTDSPSLPRTAAIGVGVIYDLEGRAMKAIITQSGSIINQKDGILKRGDKASADDESVSIKAPDGKVRGLKDHFIVPVEEAFFSNVDPGSHFIEAGLVWRKISTNESMLEAGGGREDFEDTTTVYAIDEKYVVTKRFGIGGPIEDIDSDTLVIIADYRGNYALGVIGRSVAKRGAEERIFATILKQNGTDWKRRRLLSVENDEIRDVIPATEDSFGLLETLRTFMHDGELWRKTTTEEAVSESGQTKRFEDRTDVYGISFDYALPE